MSSIQKKNKPVKKINIQDLDPNNPFHARIIENYRVVLLGNGYTFTQVEELFQGKNKD